MMKIVIVDDEYFVRIGIATVTSKIPGIKIVGEAENGKNAVDIILDTQPDLVFLDITMPIKDGLTVLKELRQKNFNNKIILLTSHDDFELSRKALRLGADDYILKNELIGDKMLNYLKKIQKETSEEKKTENYSASSHISETNSLYKERFLQTLLRSGGINEQDFKLAREEYQLQLSTSNFYIVLIEFDNWRKILQNYSEASLQTYYQKIKAITETHFSRPFEYESFYNRQNQYSLLIADPSEPSALSFENSLKEKLIAFTKQIKSLLSITVKLAVYRNLHPLEEINRAYVTTHQLLDQQFFEPDKQFFWKGVLNSYPSSDMSRLRQKTADLEKNQQLLSTVLKEFLQENNNKLIDEKEFFSIVLPIVRDLNHDSLRGQVQSEDFENINSLIKAIKEMEEERAALNPGKQYSHLTKQALLIIHKEFKRRVTLEEISRELDVSPSYFSRLFSNETGIPFSQYLTQKRIEYAQSLLVTTNLKLYEISEMAGFSSPVYFNNSFKKIHKMTPQQYRNQH